MEEQVQNNQEHENYFNINLSVWNPSYEEWVDYKVFKSNFDPTDYYSLIFNAGYNPSHPSYENLELQTLYLFTLDETIKFLEGISIQEDFQVKITTARWVSSDNFGLGEFPTF